jgi:hypothetical protein
MRTPVKRERIRTVTAGGSNARTYGLLVMTLTGFILTHVLAAPGDGPSLAMAEGRSMPLPIVAEETTTYRWLRKPVHDFLVLDDMDNPEHWTHRGHGRMEFTRERARVGMQSLRLLSPTKGEVPGSTAGRPFGEAAARRGFDGANWQGYNRISFWVYPHLPGFNVISLLVKLHNDGEVKVPDAYNREGLHYVLLEGDQWNQVVWEIPHLARDKVTALEFIYRLQGNEPGATETVQYDFDRLELQRVDADPYEGWTVAPGRIAYSHSGYAPDARKTALVSGMDARKFTVRDMADGRVAFTGRLRTHDTTVGRFQALDFTEVTDPGVYRLEVGSLITPAFQIGLEVWRDSIWKTINHFYCQRCGDAIPGIHGVCHEDWRAIHQDQTIVINGGWHDAGDLSQGLVNTAEAVYAMFHLAGTLREVDPVLAERLIEEANWGLDWVHKTRFEDGSRMSWATMDFWTDGVVGTVDDVLGQVRKHPMDNSVAASAQARAAQVLPEVDAGRAGRSLDQARQDWESAMAQLDSPGVELASMAALASLELFRATGESTYGEKAIELGEVIMACQQRERMDWEVPLSGFFYRSPAQERLLHYNHRGHEQAPIVALAGLCEAFPEHMDWMRWYSAVALHSEYLKRIAAFTEPYGMIPASVYRLDESEDPRFQEQVLLGIRMDANHYLRRFPVWFDFRGNSGTILSQAKALSTAFRLRGDLELRELVWRQLEWHVGRNPFAQSLMYGEGHDYAPQYTAMSGDIVGSLPVGVQTRANLDLPYWPASNCYNWKEVWVHPSSRWLYIMSDLLDPALNRPQALPGLDRFDVRLRRARGDTVRIEARLRGNGVHQLALRAHNLIVAEPQQRIDLGRGRTRRVTWSARIAANREPWVAVVVPDGVLGARQEVNGF